MIALAAPASLTWSLASLSWTVSDWMTLPLESKARSVSVNSAEAGGGMPRMMAPARSGSGIHLRNKRTMKTNLLFTGDTTNPESRLTPSSRFRAEGLIDCRQQLADELLAELLVESLVRPSQLV